VRESTKYEHVVAFADELPSIREKVREHMALRGLPREKVLATVVHLLESTLIRVGNDDYAKQNNSYGLTTLKNRHVAVDGNEVRFRFTGKSGKQWSLRVRDRRIAKIIKACQELPGQELIQYVDDGGHCRDVTSTDVNDYLREITGKDITAKDFRTWAGTVLAACALLECPDQGTRRLAAVPGDVAERGLRVRPALAQEVLLEQELHEHHVLGLFVDPDPGPVLANYGLDNLRFLTPVYPRDTLTVTMTCKEKKARQTEDYGEVRWDLQITQQDGNTVATYDVLTLVAKKPG
jgi:hypothetical protein